MAKHPPQHENHADQTDIEDAAKNVTIDETASDETASDEPASISEQALDKLSGGVQTEGSRARRHFAMKNFLPDPDWINKNVVAHGKGAKATIGRIYGYATSSERKANDWQGKMIESVNLKGLFTCENYINGEISNPTVVYFPLAYAEKVEAVFKADPQIKMVEIDADIGLEATGKAIPYEWVVVAYREGEEMAVLKKLRQSRQRPSSVLISPTGEDLQLTGPKK